MKETVVRIRLLVVFILAASALAVWIPLWSTEAADVPGTLQVTFFDVGQGDAIFIETPDGVQVLIDGGRDGTVLRELSKVLPWSDRTLDIVIGTHPDLDHIGGLIDVLERYEVTTIVTTENTGESTASGVYQKAMSEEGAELVYARAGQVFQLGASTTLTVLSPARDPSFLESNTSSIVVQLRYGDAEFMLTGDAPQSIEDYLVTQYGDALASDVLKLGHHGSKTSTSELFLATVQPSVAVVSAGADNRYGHPHEEVLNRTKASGAQIINTTESGSITLFSDGKVVKSLERDTF